MFWGIMLTMEGKKWSHIIRRYVSQASLTGNVPHFRWSLIARIPSVPCFVVGKKLLETEGDTHTHTARQNFFRDIPVLRGLARLWWKARWRVSPCLLVKGSAVA